MRGSLVGRLIDAPCHGDGVVTETFLEPGQEGDLRPDGGVHPAGGDRVAELFAKDVEFFVSVVEFLEVDVPL